MSAFENPLTQENPEENVGALTPDSPTVENGRSVESIGRSVGEKALQEAVGMSITPEQVETIRSDAKRIVQTAEATIDRFNPEEFHRLLARAWDQQVQGRPDIPSTLS